MARRFAEDLHMLSFVIKDRLALTRASGKAAIDDDVELLQPDLDMGGMKLCAISAPVDRRIGIDRNFEVVAADRQPEANLAFESRHAIFTRDLRERRAVEIETIVDRRIHHGDAESGCAEARGTGSESCRGE